MNMFEKMIESKMENTMNTKYPHLRLPIAVYAKVTSVQVFIDHYKYSIKILKENREVDDNFPEIPDVKGARYIIGKCEDRQCRDMICQGRECINEGYKRGDIVTVLLLYGQLNPFIVDKVV